MPDRDELDLDGVGSCAQASALLTPGLTNPGRRSVGGLLGVCWSQFPPKKSLGGEIFVRKVVNCFFFKARDSAIKKSSTFIENEKS